MFDGLKKEEKLKRAKKLHIQAASADSDFQREAKEDFEFRDGFQWTKQEKQLLEADNRPCLTFNLIFNSIELIKGLNEDTKVRFFATPVEPSDDFLCEVLTNAADYARTAGGAEEAEDDTFESSATCGRGWQGIDFDPDPKRLGHILLNFPSIPVHEVKKDPSSRRQDLGDASHIFWEKWLTEEDFKIRYPKYASHMESIRETGQMSGPLYTGKPDSMFEVDDLNEEDISDYSTPLDISYFNRSRNMVRVIHMEYWQAYRRYYGFSPETGKTMEFEKKNLKRLQQAWPLLYKDMNGEGKEFEYVTVMDKKVKWLQFIGDKILYDGDSPLPYDGFSIVPCFAYSDASRRTGNNFGPPRLMRDPQREVNKRRSQAINLLNTQVQPGVFIEDGVFVDDEQGRASLKIPGEPTIVVDGAIKEGRIQERPVPVPPTAPMQLEEAALSIMKRVSPAGNPDLLGMDSGRQEPGVVLRTRLDRGIMLLKPLYKNNNRMKKEIYRRTLAVIVKYMPDEQIMDILGQTERYVIQNGVIYDKKYGQQADIRDLRNLKYNVDVEESPANKSKRVMDLSIYLEMMQNGFPVDPNAVIEKLDIPASEKKRWLEFIEAQQKAQEEAQAQQAELEKMKILASADVSLKKAADSTQLGYEKLSEAKRKGDMKDDADAEERAIKVKGQELTFITENKRIDVQKQQQKQSNAA